MLAIGIELLGGRYIAMAYNDRDRAEWPPHPARLYSALVATWAETSARSEAERPIDDAGASALQWLAEQSAPDILASPSSEVAHRSVTPVFVPVNDVAVVSAPEREKLDAALDAHATAKDVSARAKAAKEVGKLEAKLLDVTAKSIAMPTSFGKGDARKGKAVLPESRTRQPRTFPGVTPASASVGFVWPNAQPSHETRATLAALLARLVRLGHSSSFVAARLLHEDDVSMMEASLTTYRAGPEGGEHVIRWVAPRQLRALQAAFELHRETEPRVLPAAFVAYGEAGRRVEAAPPTSIFDPNFVVLARVGGPRLPITAVAGVSRQLRRALMSGLGAEVPEFLSGHTPSGATSARPHLAIVPLPVVGAPHADGALLGVALVLPRELASSERKRVLAAAWKLGRRIDPDEPPVIHLHLGTAGTLELRLSEWGEDPRATLRPSRWTRPARTWVTATPIALDRNPGDLHAASPSERAAAFAQAEASVAMAVERIGLPRPSAIEVLRSSVLPGSAKPRAHDPFPAAPTKPQRVLVHAQIAFDRPVRGPVLVGAGRYQGMGLCLPIDQESGASR